MTRLLCVNFFHIMLQPWKYLEVFILALAAPSQGLRHHTSPKHSSTVMQAFEQQDRDTNSAGNLLSITPQSSEVSMHNRQPAWYGDGMCSNANEVRWGGWVWSPTTMSECAAACNRPFPGCYYFAFDLRNQSCHLLQGRCHVIPNDHSTTNQYYMVRVDGQWSQTDTISTSSTYTLKRGWSRNVTETDSRAVQTAASAGFSFGTGSVSGSVSKKVTSSTVSEINSVHEHTVSHNFTIEHGRYLWTWVWHVQSGSHTIDRIHTRFVVQSDVSPRCLPEYQADGTYQTCLPGGSYFPYEDATRRDASRDVLVPVFLLFSFLGLGSDLRR